MSHPQSSIPKISTGSRATTKTPPTNSKCGAFGAENVGTEAFHDGPLDFRVAADYIAQAETWIEIADTHYADTARGGYFLTAADTPGLITRTKHANDNAIPAGNGVFVGVFARLYHLTGDDRYRAKAEALTAAFSGELQRNFFPLSSLLNGQELLQAGQQMVIIGASGDPGTTALTDVLRHLSLPNRVLTTLSPDAELPPGHPAAGKRAVDGKATAYLCQGMTCSPPVTDPAALEAALSSAVPHVDKDG